MVNHQLWFIIFNLNPNKSKRNLKQHWKHKRTHTHKRCVCIFHPHFHFLGAKKLVSPDPVSSMSSWRFFSWAWHGIRRSNGTFAGISHDFKASKPYREEKQNKLTPWQTNTTMEYPHVYYRKYIFNGSIFHCYVSLPSESQYQLSCLQKMLFQWWGGIASLAGLFLVRDDGFTS